MRATVVAGVLCALVSLAQTPPTPSRADILRGDYGRYRANNDLLFYHLDVRVDPEKKFIRGKNTGRFRMLAEDTRIQLDLYPFLQVDKIVFEGAPLRYEREEGAVFIDFPSPLRKGQVYSIDFHYSGNPVETGRFGGLTFRKGPSGQHWINTSCEGPGASVWWPNKDQWKDEVESMKISVSVPNGLMDVSNGRFVGKTDLGDGYTRWDWEVQYPINNYSVSMNVGNYTQFSEKHGKLTLDYYVLPEHLEQAKVQFAQTRPMLRAFEHYFGPYPFPKDGFKLIDVPYSGMEHQSAVTYGNRFKNGYLERDWTGVGISLRFDFIIIHESGHEWFGNSITAADKSDMWIHEGFTTYMECLYVEKMWGYADALKYTNGYKSKVRNQAPIITARNINGNAPGDQYFKGALFLHTLRNVIGNDRLWWKILRGFYDKFKYQNILTEDVIAYFNTESRMDLTAIFNQYLRRPELPVLELKFDTPGEVAYRWKAAEPGFAMPVSVAGRKVKPNTSEWQTLKSPLPKDQVTAATDLYYIDVKRY
jgi:aminopeptidase N